MTMELVIQHWLVSVVRAAKVPGSDSLSVDSETATAEAWAQVGNATGLGQDALADLVARHFRLPRANLKEADHAWRLVPADVARRLNVFPLRYSDRHLTIASADPVSMEAERELSSVSGRSIQSEIAPPHLIDEAISMAYAEFLADQHQSAKSPQDKGKQHILVVEDDPDTRLLIRAALQKSGYRVTEVGDGASALKHLNAENDHFDLATLDLQLPDMHGVEILQALRDSLRNAFLPVIVATGNEDPKVQQKLFEAGADDFIVKPVDPTRFVTRVQAVLRRRNPSVTEEDEWG
jgi:CheY-like chemotaxis protein